MNYELAKQLRDAGYPFNFGVVSVLDSNPPIYRFSHYPTLSELIEACGDKFKGITKEYGVAEWGMWAAHDVGENTQLGSTPEEAVALLWLELNKK